MAHGRKRIIFDAMPIASQRVSGIGHALHGLINALVLDPVVAANYELILVSTRKSQPFLRHWSQPYVKYVAVPLPYRVFNRLPATRLMPFMDMFIGRGTYVFMNFRNWPLLNSTSITAIHDLSFIKHPEFVAPRNRKVLTSNIERWAKQSTVVMTGAEFIKDELVSTLNLQPEKVHVIRWGIDTDVYYRHDETAVRAATSKYDLPADYILFIGNIEPRKNIGRLIDAYMMLPADVRDRHPLVLVGGASWLSDQIEAKIMEARGRGAVIVRPETYVSDDDLGAIVSGAALMAYTSLYEGFGFPPLQAMAAGVPAVVGNNSSLPEVCGDAALYANGQDTNDIAAKVLQALTDEPTRTRLQAAGYRRIEKFTWSQTASRLIELFKQAENQR